jgi:transposase
MASASAAEIRRRRAGYESKKLSDREHVCSACGLTMPRDHASAMEILRLGLSLQPLTAVQ